MRYNAMRLIFRHTIANDDQLKAITGIDYQIFTQREILNLLQEDNIEQRLVTMSPYLGLWLYYIFKKNPERAKNCKFSIFIGIEHFIIIIIYYYY
jgi:hypothetical protein